MSEERALTIGELVKQAMKEGGFTSVRDAAAAWGLSKAGMYRLLLGRSAWPGPTTVTALSRALGMKEDEFCLAAGIPRRNSTGTTNSLGRKVKELRCMRQLTQTQLEHLMGMGTGIVSDLENGKRRYLTRDQLQRLAAALAVPEAELWATIPGGASEAKWISLAERE